MESWEAPGISGFTVGSGSGSVTVTSISNDWISGSLSVVVAARFSNSDTEPKTIQGTFELSFKERTIC